MTSGWAPARGFLVMTVLKAPREDASRGEELLCQSHQGVKKKRKDVAETKSRRGGKGVNGNGTKRRQKNHTFRRNGLNEKATDKMNAADTDGDQFKRESKSAGGDAHCRG